MFIIDVTGYDKNESKDSEINRYNSIINGLYRKEAGIILYGYGTGKTYLIDKLVSNGVITDKQIFFGLDMINVEKIKKLVNENTKFIVEITDIENDIPILFESIYSNSIVVHFSN